jgi:hypothetical protein
LLTQRLRFNLKAEQKWEEEKRQAEGHDHKYILGRKYNYLPMMKKPGTVPLMIPLLLTNFHSHEQDKTLLYSVIFFILSRSFTRNKNKRRGHSALEWNLGVCLESIANPR